MQKLTKTKFRKYLECPREFWLSVHHPEEITSFITPDIAFRIRQGYEVERIVKAYMSKQKDHEYEFQKSIETERLIARFDVFAKEEGEDGSHIYEIKSSKFIDPKENKRKKDREMRLLDVGFQVFTAREAGLYVSKASLITLNGDYKLGGRLDAEGLLKFEDVSEEVEVLQADIGERIERAFELLETEPEAGFDDLCSKKLECEYFNFKMPDLPNPTIFNIPRLHKNKASLLLGINVLDVKDVPGDFGLTPTQQDYVDFVNAGEKRIDKAAINERLGRLEYPLYFLDYETVNPSIPQFEGMAPLQQITFQYSVHIRETRESDVVHHEFLSHGEGTPPLELAESLSKVIGDEGSVIVWYKHFEMGRNDELAELYPQFAAFFESINERIFDLYEVFSQKLYRDPALKNNSIKSVLPVLVPGLSYENMDIADGGLAMSRWYDEVYQGKDDTLKAKTIESLCEYCKLDTLAMVEILKALEAL